jgi:dTDP-4-amino-4,6-dideoxygalactose transaminase
MSKLELPRDGVFRKFKWIEEDDIAEIGELLRSGDLSGFLGTKSPSHLGGEQVKLLEALWAKLARTQGAVTFNSWTSGLEASVAALGLKTGLEVIVTPWTMAATGSAIINNDLIPVFCDIEPSSYNLDPNQVEKLLSPKTGAIIAVDIFGKPCAFDSLNELAKSHNVPFVIDAAQTPLATTNGYRSSEFADISGYSFNRHKHLQCGEGGIAVTNNLDYLKRMQCYRNHAEVTTESDDLLVSGHNLRLGEMESKLIIRQLARIEKLVGHRRQAAVTIIEGLSDIKCISLPEPSLIEHDFYILGINLHREISNNRKEIYDELKSLGTPGIMYGYENIQRYPAFRKFNPSKLPVAERLQDHEFLGVYMCGIEWSSLAIEVVIENFRKVLLKL